MYGHSTGTVATALVTLLLILPPHYAGAADGFVRQDITAASLLHPQFAVAGTVHNDNFAAPPNAGPALHDFSGTLAVPGARLRYARPDGQTGPWKLPAFAIEFFTHGDHLVPVTRGFIDLGDGGRHPRLLISPGRVWSEASDNGFSRASFPFLLTYRFYNGARNGIATFIYDERRVSAVRFQIIQENARGRQYDVWGQGAADYQQGAIADQEALAAQFAT